MSWAVAQLRNEHVPLRDSLAAAALPRISLFNPQSLASTASAFSSLAYYHLPLLESIAAEAISRLEEFELKELVNTAWYMAHRQ